CGRAARSTASAPERAPSRLVQARRGRLVEVDDHVVRALHAHEREVLVGVRLVVAGADAPVLVARREPFRARRGAEAARVPQAARAGGAPDRLLVVSATLANIGRGEAAPFTVALTVGGNAAGESRVAALAGGAATTVQVRAWTVR